MYSENLIVALPQGLHARPATELVNTAKQFKSRVTISRDGQSADAKSILGLMSLAIPKGATVTVSADGPDEQAAVGRIAALITQNS